MSYFCYTPDRAVVKNRLRNAPGERVTPGTFAGKGVYDWTATSPSINLLLLNCPSQYTPISITSNHSTARAYAFNVASSSDGVILATIADGNDTIACNSQGGTLWQITAYYESGKLAWKYTYNQGFLSLWPFCPI